MSEKIYAWLLRLYPSHFRKAYGDAALQLFRDRSRDERGLFPGLRLWLDLLADLAVSVPLEYRRAQPALIDTSAPQRLDGTPVFHVLEKGALRFEARLCGGLLSLVAFVSILVLAGHGGSYRPLGDWAARSLIASPAPSSVLARPAQAANLAEEEPIVSGEPTRGAGSMGRGNPKPSGFLSMLLLLPGAPGSPQAQVPQPRIESAARATDGVAKLDAAERERVLDAVIQNLRAHYFDPDVAGKMVAALLEHQKNGDDDAVTDAKGFADLLSGQMRNVSQDMHLGVFYSQNSLPDHPPEQTPERLERYRKAMEQENCMFKKIEMLPHNVGYLKLNFFPDTSVCQSTATAAMASLNDADAIIFDLRDNRGGFPNMVSLIASYLFDRPEYLYNPREAPTEQSWTRSPVPGNRLANKPVYILTSGATWSGAEQFSYDMKMLKRATLVGETTRGGAHAGVFHRIDDHFGMGIPEEKAINPFGKADWEGVGVEPDVKVKAADALETAEKLAESKLLEK